MPETTNSTALETGHHDRRLARRLKDPEFRAAYDRERAEIAAVDSIINSLERLRDEQHISKAELARRVGKNPAAIRRLLTASGNPELRTVVALAGALDVEIQLVPRHSDSRPLALSG